MNGVLNVTRSLGDLHAKPMISSTPDTTSFALDESHYLLMLSSDGIWDTLTESEIYDALQAFMATNSIESMRIEPINH